MTKILVVDDDPHIRELVRLNLEREGFEILEATHGEEGISVFESTKPDMIVLDIMMPKMNGWDFCLAVRESSILPLLMMTAMGQTSDKIKGFQLGIDDYLVKPFDPLELVARVKAILKRYRISVDQTVQIGELILDRGTYTASKCGKGVPLPPKEFELLFKLASYSGQTLTREQLIEDIWGFDYEGDERTVDVHIKRLRERFPQEHFSFRITTVRGLGYRLEVSHD